jgi:hypothetical protein
MKRLGITSAMFLLCVGLAACNQQTNKNQNQKAEGERHGLRRACATEIQQYCAGQRGRERRDCLQNHQAQLSDTCKTALSERGAGRGGRRHRGGL